MRWRFVDRVGSIEPWARVRGEKCVSLEEYFLLERLGRRGTLPESLLLASFVELGRWLVIVSSDFELSAVLTEITGFGLRDSLSMGAVLDLELAAASRGGNVLTLRAKGVRGQAPVCDGTMSLALRPLRELSTTVTARRLWQEVHAAAR
jgi:hypothetical protein